MIANAEVDYYLGKGNMILGVLSDLSLIVTVRVNKYYQGLRESRQHSTLEVARSIWPQLMLLSSR